MEKPKLEEYSKERLETIVKSVVKKIEKNQAILFSIDEENILNGITLILKSISTQTPIIYVSLRQDHNSLNELFEKEHLNPQRFFYISPSKQKQPMKNCKYITKPSDINVIEIAIKNWQKEIKGEKILIFDSISTLFVYHKPDTAQRFVHRLANELKNETKSLFVIASEDLEKNKTILTFFPETVTLQ